MTHTGGADDRWPVQAMIGGVRDRPPVLRVYTSDAIDDEPKMTEPSPHELFNRELPGLPDMAAVSPVLASDVLAHAEAADVLIDQLRGMVAHLEKRVIEARIAMQQMIDDHENAFSKAWDEHELDPYAEKAFFTENEDHLEPARKWILAEAN